jgi:hypothetical protein
MRQLSLQWPDLYYLTKITIEDIWATKGCARLPMIMILIGKAKYVENFVCGVRGYTCIG